MSRLTFVKQLARELVLPHLERNYHNQRLPYELRTSIRRVLGVQAESAEYAPAQEDKLEKSYDVGYYHWKALLLTFVSTGVKMMWSARNNIYLITSLNLSSIAGKIFVSTSSTCFFRAIKAAVSSGEWLTNKGKLFGSCHPLLLLETQPGSAEPGELSQRNFIVNSKSVTYNYCNSAYHSHCTKLKDIMLKCFSEKNASLMWFCNAWLANVHKLLSASATTTIIPVEEYPSAELQITQKENVCLTREKNLMQKLLDEREYTLIYKNRAKSDAISINPSLYIGRRLPLKRGN
nr:unnamed protein product [Callosobruchus chinensis]